MRFIDLFAGIGGFHIAFENIGKCVFISENDEKAIETYKHNFNSLCPFLKDINNFNPDVVIEHDVLCAGFPCQPFSVAGYQEGFSHKTQGNLFFNIIAILKAKLPPVVFLENVKNLISHDKGNTFKVIISELENIGYTVKYKILNASEYGNLPQNRERVYIVGFQDKQKAQKFSFPAPIPLTTKLFGDIIHLNVKADETLYQTNINSPSVKKMIKHITEKEFIYQYRRYYVRKNKYGFCPTLTANMGSGGHNVPLILDNFGVRKLSIRECLDLQGFPKYFEINVSNSSAYKQIGNAVPVPVVKRIAEKIKEVLNDCQKTLF